MSPLRLSRRRAHLDVPNPLRALTEVIDARPGGINLGQGVCDLDMPEPLRRGAVASIEGGDRQTYTHYAGIPELRRAIARKLCDWNGLDVAADGVVVTTGSSSAFIATALTLFDPGDEVLLLEPFYSYHRSQLLLLGLVPVSVPATGEALALDPGALARAIGPRTRGLVLNTPGNPSGRVLARAELEAVAGVLDGTDVAVVTDEVYEYLCYDGRRHCSPGTVPGLAGRTVTLGGFSKTFSVTGWRVGYVAGPRDTVDAVGKVFDQLAVCAPRPLQRGVAQALAELPPSFYDELGRGYQAKRDRLCAALAAAGFRCRPPEGAYYVLADYRDVLGDLEPAAASAALIERAGINAVPGRLFYEHPEGIRTVRFHFAVTPATLDEVCRRLAALGAGGTPANG
jgi:aminotransferase